LIQIPYYRVDVTRPADVIEEILRVYGYNNIVTSDLLESRLPTFVSSNDHQIAERLSNHLVSLGFHEMINNSISSPDYGEISKSLKDMKRVNIINPLGQELSQMRSSLLPGALEVLAFNINRQSKSLKFFEFGKTYQQANGAYKEEKYLSIAISGDVYNENWNVVHQPQIFFYFKGIIQQLLKKNCSIHWQESSSGKDIFSDGLVFTHKMKTILDFGFIRNDILQKFNINQEVLFAEINFSILADLVKNNNVHYNEIPKYPQIRRDFSLLIDDSIPFEALKKIALNTEKNVLKNVQLFDVYEGNKLPKGKKSYGVSFYFQDPKKTMTDKYIDKIMGKLQNQFEKEFGAQLR